MDIDPLELARQLTIMESELFFKVKPRECIARLKKLVPVGPNNIKNIVTTTNKVCDINGGLDIGSLLVDGGLGCERYTKQGRSKAESGCYQALHQRRGG